MADALYRMKDNFYVCVTDLLYDMEIHPAFDLQVIEILIGTTPNLMDMV